MRTRLALLPLLLSSTALMASLSSHAQAPSPAQMGVTQGTPQSLQALDSTKTWVPLGSIDPANHAFTGYGADGTDVRSFGCVDDGVTDQAACLNNAINLAPGCAIIPSTANGFYVAPGSTVIAKKCLKGAFFNPDYPTPYSTAFAGTPWLKCGTSGSSVCVKTTYDGAYLSGLTIAAQFPPAAGSIGLQVAGGYNSQLRDVYVSGFDSCALWGPESTTNGGISSHAIGLNLSLCQTHYVVQDGWPELYITDGRWGANAQGALTPSPQDFVYITKSLPAGAGAGPNSLVMTNVQVNPGGGKVQCMVRFGGFTGAVANSGGWRQFKFIGNHWEFLAPTPDATKPHGAFCADSSVDSINQLYVTNTEFGFDGAGGGGIFDISEPFTANTTSGSFTLTGVSGLFGPADLNINHGQWIIGAGVPSGSYIKTVVGGATVTFDNPTHTAATATATGVSMTAATGMQNNIINASFFGVDNFTLVMPPGGIAATESQFTSNYIGGAVHLTGDPSQWMALADNRLGPMTIDGTWGRFSSSFDHTSSIDTGSARGSISMANPVSTAWTPVVKFGGVASTLSWTTGGLMFRTPTGGFTASFNVTATGGTETSHGTTQITGLPFKCGALFRANPPYTQTAFAAGVGVVTLLPNSSDPTGINVFKAFSTGTGYTNTTDVDFTNASVLAGVITCENAL